MFIQLRHDSQFYKTAKTTQFNSTCELCIKYTSDYICYLHKLTVWNSFKVLQHSSLFQYLKVGHKALNHVSAMTHCVWIHYAIIKFYSQECIEGLNKEVKKEQYPSISANLMVKFPLDPINYKRKLSISIVVVFHTLIIHLHVCFWYLQFHCCH